MQIHRSSFIIHRWSGGEMLPVKVNVTCSTVVHQIEALWADLERLYPGLGRREEPLSAHTTLRLGGPAEIWFPAGSAEALVSAVSLARRHQAPVFILGGGANLLIRDVGVRGLVIENRANAVHFSETGLVAESGAVLPRLAKQCAQRGLSGLEWAVGVPGTVGGAVVNNAGAYGRSMAGTLVRANLLLANGERTWQPVEWFDYDYRASKLKRMVTGKPIVLQAELALPPAPREEIEATMQTYNARRKVSQPPGATIGSMFKNPPGDYAGRLIEAAGLKGFRVNQAQISPVHANFFINLGGAKSEDVLALIETAQRAVQDKFGLELELEIEIV
jgi:UDP-N-acetylmuramate dehydrogenase